MVFPTGFVPDELSGNQHKWDCKCLHVHVFASFYSHRLHVPDTRVRPVHLLVVETFGFRATMLSAMCATIGVSKSSPSPLAVRRSVIGPYSTRPSADTRRYSNETSSLALVD